MTENIEAELQMIQGLSVLNPAIVPYEYFFLTLFEQIYLVLVWDFYPTQFNEAVEISPIMSEDDASNILKLLQIINFIHSRFHVHLNIKIQNIFIED